MENEAIEKVLLPVSVAKTEQRDKKVRAEFWSKFTAFAGQLPFAEDVAASYYCATDAKTPFKVRGTLLAALAYFILPLDTIPDFLAVIGFGDDIAVFTAALTMVQNHITEEHREKARRAIEKSQTEDA